MRAVPLLRSAGGKSESTLLTEPRFASSLSKHLADSKYKFISVDKAYSCQLSEMQFSKFGSQEREKELSEKKYSIRQELTHEPSANVDKKLEAS